MATQMELDDRTLRIIADSNPGDFGIYRVDNGRLSTLLTSDGLAELSGMPRQEYDALTREDASAVILESDLPKVIARLGALLSGNGTADADVTYRILHKKLGHIWVHARGRLIGTKDGCPVLLVAYSRSSSEAAGQSRLLDLTTAILYVIDKDSFEILFANETALRIWGHGDYAGRSCYRYINGRSEPCPWCSVPLIKNGACHVDAAYSEAQDRWFSVDCREIDWYGHDAVAVYARDVTEQQRQQRQIRTDRDKLDTILGNIPGGVAVFFSCGGIIKMDYTNNGFYELHHGSRAYWDSVSSNPLDWLSEADRQAFCEEFDRVERGEKTQGSSTYCVTGEDGSPHWVNNQFRRAYMRAGVQYYYATFVDMDDWITAQMREDESYRKAMRQLVQAADNTLGSFSVNLTTNWCGDGKSVYDFVLKQAESGTADGYFLTFAGIISDEDIRKQSLALFNREGLIQRFLRGETQVTLEYPVRYRNGEIHWQRGVMDMMRNPKTGDIEALTHALDIDRQKRGEQISQNVLSDRLDFAAIIYPCSGDIDFYAVQPSVTRVAAGTRCPYEEIRVYLREEFVLPAARADFDSCTELEAVLAQIRESGICHCYYRRIQNGQETYRHLQYNWLDPEQSAILVIQSDITDSHRQEQRHMNELRQALAAAEQANSAKTDFLSRMSHDMRTPLNGIIGMTYLAGEQDNPARTSDCLAKIDLSSKFLLGLINDVLDMSKAESGAIHLHPEPYSMSEFKQYVDAVIRPLCEGKSQELVTEYAMPEGCAPLVDKLRMNQIVFNLLSNAVKYSPEGSRILYRDTSSLLPDGRISDRIEVSDQGIGMSPEFQKVLFEPFTQENRIDNSEMRGSGLGLAITKKLLDAMGGSISVESRLGKGTTIRVELVFDRAAARPAEALPAAAQGPRDTRLAGKHVLLCEDHPLNQEIAKALLAERGLIVDVSDNGASGLKAFENSSVGFFDCVLMDIRMPVMDGYEATKAIRALRRPDANSVPILAMTADAFADDVQKCLDAGMNGHIAKPIDPQNLYSALLKCIAAENRP